MSINEHFNALLRQICLIEPHGFRIRYAYARSGADEIRFNLGDELSKTKITSFGAQKNPENYKSNFLTDSTPLFDGRYLTLICYGGGEHYLISVDMVEGKLIEVSSLQKFLK